MVVILYTTVTCPYCRMLKDYLSEKGIAYTEKYVDQDTAARDEMMERSGGFLGVPFTVIDTGSGEPVSIIGFDKKRINSALGIEE
ncbi:hypothetical protein A2801_04300 [Candidatus Woesebacteria bacterium RIFCSPHIGHO2_01_FULL_41_10]|uniref:Glutaredoxin domain-containing protein n=1 Tax=Candidatus Woesebacteria bacterium RIFCSPHIGHO2_01_FULL_41_10 TaxID=1802500 RepID=A0A1F7YP07_9BACT|nr:MAG: hypothetical protein A2801_04300 [Candidatus Woesebacteria bacterium RIFCSPHIGHO2_01_FULL_41_10]